jgi:centromeric protein E
MMGSRGEDGQPGVIPLALASIFHYMEDQSSHREFILRCSYLELYNEVLTDLLDSQSGKKLTIKEDSQRNVSVQGLTEHVVMDCNEALSFILTGEGEGNIGCFLCFSWLKYALVDVRRVAETAMNERSSRSHTIYRLTLESKEMGGDMVKVSVLVSFAIACVRTYQYI